MEMIFTKEAGDNEEFETRGLNKWVNDKNEVKFRKTWDAINKEVVKETFDPTTDTFTLNGFGGLDTYLTKVAPTPIIIPAMPTPTELSKWIADTIQKQVLKSLSKDDSVLYQEAVAKVTELQDVIEKKDLIKKLSANANTNFQKVFPDLSLSISPQVGQEIDISKALDKEFCIAINQTGEEHKSEFKSHGHGVIRQAMFNFLGLSKSGLEATEHLEPQKKEFIILFEEPELYLHPKRIRLLKETLYSLCHNSKFQILCASHNPQLIDLSKPHTTLARLIQNDDKTTSIHQVGKGIFEPEGHNKDRILMLNRFNPHVCETFFADEVILVEGDTEAIILRELLNENYPEKDIFVLNTGTKNNMPFFIDVLSHFRIKQHVIHDSDCRYQYKNNAVVLKENGDPKNNSAWTLNQKIWDKITEHNQKVPGITRRYVSVKNFEDSHNYVFDNKKGKPFSAWEFAQTLDIDGDASIVKFVRQIAGVDRKVCDFTQENLDDLVNEQYVPENLILA